jgi:uncharacterized membrane protein YhaH (DUF805 family)
MQGRSRFWLSIVIAAVAAVLLGLFGLSLLIWAIHSRNATGGAGKATGILVGVLLLCGCASCVLTIIHLEHRLRGHPAGKIAADPLADVYRNAPASWRRPRRRRNSPVTCAIVGVALLALTAGSFIAASSARTQADQSSYVQAHGLQRTALVLSVQNIQHQSRSSTWYTAQVTATLSPPVNGDLSTTVYVPNGVSYRSGNIIAVLVDPANPTYSELPGQPFVTSSEWIGDVVAGVFFAIFGCLLVVTSALTIRRRHAWRATLPAAAQTAPSSVSG